MKPVGKMTQGELGAFIQSQLREKGIEVILSGGAAVAIYSNNKYVSRDLDLINIYGANRRKIRDIMTAIGFYEEGRYFRHPDSKFFVEFPPGPLTIGEEPVKQIIEKKLSTGVLKVISPHGLCQRQAGSLLSLGRSTITFTGNPCSATK